MRVKCNKEGIEKDSNILKSGGIVVFPTNTVYGIGCNPYNKEAIQRIYKIKSKDGEESTIIEFIEGKLKIHREVILTQKENWKIL